MFSKVIIEGPDGAGKSTLVDYLIEKYEMEVVHSSSETENTFDYHFNLLHNDEKIVYDRFNLGEIVYPSVYGRQRMMDLREQEVIMDECVLKKIPYIIFYTTDINVLKERLLNRGDTEQVIENIESINEMFRACAAYFSRNYKNVLALDIAKEDDQVKAFENFIKELNNE